MKYTTVTPPQGDKIQIINGKLNVPDHHDPFDLMMICQAAVNGMLFVSEDERIAEYTDPCIYVP